MATHFRESTSIDTLADACDAIASGLAADPETDDLGARWSAIRERTDAVAARVRSASRAARRARQAVLVSDARWDAVEASFGRAVVDATGGLRDRAPYTRFFGDRAPSDVATLGSAREVALARRWLAELGREPDEALAKAWMAPLAAATDALEAAVGARVAAVEAMGRELTGVELLREDLNREIDRLEGELLKRFPAAPRRSMAFLQGLAAARRQRSQAADEGADDVAGDDAAATAASG